MKQVENRLLTKWDRSELLLGGNPQEEVRKPRIGFKLILNYYRRAPAKSAGSSMFLIDSAVFSLRLR